MICIVNCGTTWLKEIENILEELGFQCAVVNLEEIEKYDFKSFSGVIISGAAILLTEVDLEKYKKLFQFIKTTPVPILGICLGHQIIGVLYGSKIHRGEMINKKEQIEIVKNDSLFSGIENYSPFQEEHSESITLPEKFDLLAKSETCGNEAMKHRDKALHGVQFHPEVSGDVGKRVIKNFLGITN